MLSLPQHESLVHMLLAAVEAQPDLPAVIFEQQRITYAEFGRAVAGLAKRLEAAGAKRGERVILLMANSIEMDVALMAVMATCAQVAPVNPFLTLPELKKQLGDLSACAIVCDKLSEEKAAAVAAEFGIPTRLTLGAGGIDARRMEARRVAGARSLAPAEARRYRAAAVHGRLDGRAEGRQPHASRAAVLDLAARDGVAVQVRRRAVLERRADVSHLGARLLDVGADLHAEHARHGAALRGRQSRARALRSQDHDLRGRPRADLHGPAREPGIREGGSLAAAVLPVRRRAVPRGAASRMAREDGPADPRRLGHDGGRAVLPEPVRRQAQAAVGRQSRAGHGAASRRSRGGRPRAAARRARRVARARPAADDGLSQSARGDGAHLRDGWVYTGDIGYADEDGFVFLVDRKKDMVIVGGYNVYPREVDEVLFKHPKIREAATVGKRDARLGEVLVAFVVLDAGAALTEDEFFEYCKTEMVKYKRPVEVHFVEALPKTGTNKINRRALRERV